MKNLNESLADFIQSIVKETLSSSESNEQPTQTVPAEETYLNTQEAKAFVKIKSDVTFHNKCKAGLIPRKKIGRPYVYKLSDLKSYLNGN